VKLVGGISDGFASPSGWTRSSSSHLPQRSLRSLEEETPQTSCQHCRLYSLPWRALSPHLLIWRPRRQAYVQGKVADAIESNKLSSERDVHPGGGVGSSGWRVRGDNMTTQKKLKALVRARMNKTGESYMVARRHLLNQIPADEYVLRGGIHPETSSLANALASRGITNPTNGRPLSEAMILGVGGGLGAEYILWQFEKHHRRVVVTIGFRNSSQYPDRWFRKTCERLGVPIEIHETSGEKRAAGHLQEALAAGLPAIAFITAADLPYWHLPSEESGWWGYTIVVVGQEGERYLVDDRNLKPLTVADEDLRAARGRISSYKNRLIVVDPAAIELDNDGLVRAIEAGLVDQVEHLSAKSDSFSLPAIAKWARMLTDERNPKGWGTAFADGEGLVEALVSTYEGVTDVGIHGGNLRSMYADFLREAGKLTGRPLVEAETAYRKAAGSWEEFAAVCLEVPIVKTIVELDRGRREAIRNGDEGWEEALSAGPVSGRLLRSEVDLGEGERRELFNRMAEALRVVHGNEVNALEALVAAMR